MLRGMERDLAMPERTAIVTALITERPLCLSCIALRASLAEPDTRAVLDKIERVLTLQRVDPGRCRACGAVGTVLSIDQPPT
jgi:hypothetical protein